MKDAAKLLGALIGVPILRVAVQVLFHGVEQQGDWGDLLLFFGNGRTIVLGCAGDGTVLVSLPRVSATCAPAHASIELRDLDGMSGDLTRFEMAGNRLSLVFQEGALDVANDDDELVFHINGVKPSETLLKRA